MDGMDDGGISATQCRFATVVEGQLTLVGAFGGHITVGVDLDVRAVPGDIEVSLDDHVCC